MKLDIGSVTFAKRGLDWREAPMGDYRIELLRKFYRGEELDNNWIAVAYNPTREVSKEDVNWETAGPRVMRDQCKSEERLNGVRCVKLDGHLGSHSCWPQDRWTK